MLLLAGGSRRSLSRTPMYDVLAIMARKRMVYIGCVHAHLESDCSHGVSVCKNQEGVFETASFSAAFLREEKVARNILGFLVSPVCERMSRCRD